MSETQKTTKIKVCSLANFRSFLKTKQYDIYTIKTILNWPVRIIKEIEYNPSLHRVKRINQRDPIENWDVSNARTQIYNFWWTFFQVSLYQKKARIMSSLTMQFNRKKYNCRQSYKRSSRWYQTSKKRTMMTQNVQMSHTSSSTIIIIKSKFC